MMDNLSQQVEELEVLSSIYGNQWKSEGGTDSFSIEITRDVKLWITLNDNYPSDAPPSYELLAPALPAESKQQVCAEFQDIQQSNCGGPVLFQWIERLKEIVETYARGAEPQPSTIEDFLEVTKEEVKDLKKESKFSLEVTHGNIIQDRKSTFQGHVCAIQNEQEAKLFMNYLLENKKIAQATHNISARRIELANGNLLQDCDDDGETHAGGRLLHLLQILDVKNTMVVVTRWYGGIHLGPDRFKHINNAAREALQQAGFIKQT